MDEETTQKPYGIDDNMCGCGTIKEVIDQAMKNISTMHETGDCVIWDIMSLLIQAQLVASMTANVHIMRNSHPDMTDEDRQNMMEFYALEAAAWYQDKHNLATNIIGNCGDYVREKITELLKEHMKKRGQH